MEEVMLDLMYDLPELKIDGARYVLDRDAIEQKKQLAEVLVIKKESA
jgi:ATP-dependent protease Clp ATPase subunit